MIHLDTPGPIGGITVAIISIVAVAEKTFSVEIGPTFALVLTGMIASIGSWITAWLAYRLSAANKVKVEETDVKITQVHDAVNSTARDLAAKLTASETALLEATRQLAEAKATKIQSDQPLEVKVINPVAEPVPVQSDKPQ